MSAERARYNARLPDSPVDTMVSPAVFVEAARLRKPTV
jgi:hypothetical protein